MVDVLKALLQALLGIGLFLVFFLGLYALSALLKGRMQERWRILTFVGPPVALLVIGLALPAIRTIVASFFEDTQAGSGGFVWFQNYGEIFFGNSDGRLVIWNSILWVVIVTFFSTAIGLTIARLADKMKGESVAKALIFLPTAISLVGAGVIWKFVYAFQADPTASQYGLLNQFLVWFGITPKNWLLEKPINNLFLMVIMIWIQAGFATVVLSASLKGVDDSLLEAARIDGATESQVFFRIVVPNIWGTIVTVLTTTVIAVLKVFDVVQAITGGNFGTNVIANDVYLKSFPQDRPNYGSALAVLLFIAVVPVVYINIRNQRRMREMA